MNSNFVISAILGLGWLFAILMGIALLAMANFVGSQYAYTQLGVTRTGPKLGKRLGSTTFAYQGTKKSLKDVASKKKWTLFTFLDTSPVSDNLIPDLLGLASFAQGDIEFVVFCHKVSERLSGVSDANTQVKIIELGEIAGDLETKLGIRVLPFALLVNQETELIAKGLINHTPHLCVLIHNAKARVGAREELAGVSATICQPFLEEIQHTIDTVYSQKNIHKTAKEV